MTLSDDDILKKYDSESVNNNDNNNFSTISNDDTDNNNVIYINKNKNNIISTPAPLFIRSNAKTKTKNFRFNVDELINEYLHVPTRCELSFEDHILLWWKSNDFRRFKMEAINEIKDIVKIQPHFNVRQAMSAMYQSESQELIDNTCRNSRRFITSQQQIHEKSNNNNNNNNYSHNINYNNVKKDYDDSRKDDDHNNDNNEDCVIQIRSRFLCSRKHFQSSKKQEDHILIPNDNIVSLHHHPNYKRDDDNNTSNIINNNHDDNTDHKVHDNQSDEKIRIDVDDITNKSVMKTHSQRSSNYHFILTAYLILWLCAVWGIVFHQVVTFYKYQKQQK